MNKPQFRSHFRVEVIEPSTVYLLSENKNIALNGKLYARLALLLNGKYTVEDIYQQLKAEFSVDKIKYALERLQVKGYICEANDKFTESVAAFWSLLNIDIQTADNILQQSAVTITRCGNIPTQPLKTALESVGISQIYIEENWQSALTQTQTQSTKIQKSLLVVLTDEYLKPELQQLNQTALETQQPWLLIKPVGSTTWLGPIFTPNNHGCWQCLAHRLYGNREVESAIAEQTGSWDCFQLSRAILPSTLQISIQEAATEIAKWFVLPNIPSPLAGKIITFNHLTSERQSHHLTHRPQCQACGNYSPQAPQPLHLESIEKQFTVDGGHRICSPEETLKRFEHHISPVTGIVKTLTPNIKSDNPHIHSYLAVHSFGKPVNLETLRHSLRHKAAGKGRTDIQAKVSGFCEAIERYSGTYQNDEYTITATYQEIQDQAIHPYSYLHFSENQYSHRENINQQTTIDLIPQSFDETKPIEWIPLWSLTNNSFKYFPAALCYYNYPSPAENLFGVATSNGCAAGNTLEEAILQGFMELVERDSVGIWWYNRLPKCQVDLTTFADPFFLQVQSYYQHHNRKLWVLDLTTDIKIPVFAAIAYSPESSSQQIMIGYGAHFDASIALSRAVTELNQVWTR